MIYQYKCEKCEEVFDRNLSVANRESPLLEACPSCKSKESVVRVYTPISLTYDMMDVNTRARKVAGEGFTELMKRIHKGAGKQSRMNV